MAALLTPVYHGENGVRTLRELGRSYITVTKDLTRVMNRIKALYRSWAIPCPGAKVYSSRHRNAWLEKLLEAGVRRRAEQLYEQLDGLRKIRQQVRASWWQKVKSIRPISFSVKFPSWVPSALPY